MPSPTLLDRLTEVGAIKDGHFLLDGCNVTLSAHRRRLGCSAEFLQRLALAAASRIAHNGGHVASQRLSCIHSRSSRTHACAGG